MPPALDSTKYTQLNNFIENSDKTNTPLITIYDTGDGDIVVECFILVNNDPSEAILHVSFFAHSPDKLIYEFIDS